jgi:hypothetical protein
MSAGVQSQRNLRDIAMSRYADDIKARNAMMIEPERLPDIPKPIMPPERIFVEPMAATAGYIPGPANQSAAAPIFAGLSAAAGSAAQAAGAYNYYNRPGTAPSAPPPSTAGSVGVQGFQIKGSLLDK